MPWLAMVFLAHAWGMHEHGWRPGQEWARCGEIDVVDGAGHPVVGAEVNVFPCDTTEQGGCLGTGARTDWRGHVCMEELLYGGDVEVSAPPQRGGSCAGQARLSLEGWDPDAGKPPLWRVVLRARTLPRVIWHGRLLYAEGAPAGRASILVERAAPRGTDCETLPQVWVSTARDGTFVLPALPRGGVSLTVKHEGYAPRRFDIDLPSPARDLVLEQGAAWSGRVLAPDGSPIEAFGIRVRVDPLIDPYDRRVTACEFRLEHLPSGDGHLVIAVRDHPLLATRTLMKVVHVDWRGGRREDIRWPAGEAISGRVVTQAGTPAPYAPIKAVSKDNNEVGYFDEVDAKADAEGRFSLEHLRPGRWTLVSDIPHQLLQEVATGSKDVRLVMGPP